MHCRVMWCGVFLDFFEPSLYAACCPATEKGNQTRCWITRLALRSPLSHIQAGFDHESGFTLAEYRQKHTHLFHSGYEFVLLLVPPRSSSSSFSLRSLLASCAPVHGQLSRTHFSALSVSLTLSLLSRALSSTINTISAQRTTTETEDKSPPTSCTAATSSSSFSVRLLDDVLASLFCALFAVSLSLSQDHYEHENSKD